jgi:prepilin-type N-terminal cleavage/methylation domain-containing protein/prepilin-type processing-associated H-X9-DG protein
LRLKSPDGIRDFKAKTFDMMARIRSIYGQVQEFSAKAFSEGNLGFGTPMKTNRFCRQTRDLFPFVGHLCRVTLMSRPAAEGDLTEANRGNGGRNQFSSASIGVTGRPSSPRLRSEAPAWQARPSPPSEGGEGEEFEGVGTQGGTRGARLPWAIILLPLRGAAFTLIELLVVIAIIGILAAMLIPSLIKAKQKAQAVHCMNNNKQLMLAFLMYAGDNSEWLPANGPTTRWWVGGNGLDPTIWTNIDFLINPQYAALAPYIGSQYRIYKCPADNKYPWVDPAGNQFPIVRSCAMNGAVGSSIFALRYGPPDPGEENKWQTCFKMSDMVNPGPADLFVFIDESEYDDMELVFAVCMGVQPAMWGSWPSVRHNFAGTFAFADGHAEIHKWKDGRTGTLVPLLVPSIGRLGYGAIGVDEANPDSTDILWIQAHTSALRNPAGP